MKTFTLFFAILIFSISFNNKLSANPPDSCLKVYNLPHDTTFTNPSFVKVDSCADSPTYGQYFAKKYFALRMEYNIIPRNYIAPEDTIIEYSIENIENQYEDAIQEFSLLKSNYGDFKFIESVPNMPDTTLAYSRTFLMRFESYVPILEVEKLLKSFSSISSSRFASWFSILSSVESIDISIEKTTIFPNPVIDMLTIRVIPPAQHTLISIFNTYGQKLLETEFSEQLNVTSLTPGVYFIRIGDKNYQFIKL